MEEIPDKSISAFERLEREEQAKELEKKLASLPENDRAILLLFFREEFSLSEISELFNEPYNTVKSRYRRAIHRLKKAFLSK